MWPTAYAIVSTVNPKAKLTPKKPMPSDGKPAASTALPQPANVSQNVPKNSAPRRCTICSRSTRRDDEQRFYQYRQVRMVLNSAPQPLSLNFTFPTTPTLRPKSRVKVPRRSFSMAMAFDFRLQQLAMGQQHPQFLTA